jgi:putative membrane protein
MTFIMRGIAIILFIAAVLAGVLFSLQNDMAVPLDLLFVQMPARSLSFWLVAFWAFGVFIGLLAGALVVLRLRARQAVSQRQIKKLRLEVDALRKIGIADRE